jgi:DNA-binding NtrC family response regulator
MIGHEVVLARPESASLPSSTESLSSLVITDFMAASPNDRLDTLKHVHQVSPQAKIIALFSGDEVNQAEQQVVAKQPGVFRVLNNPFELGELLEAVQKAIKIPR